MRQGEDARTRAPVAAPRAFSVLTVGAGLVLAMTAPLELLYARKVGANVVEIALFIAVSGLGVLAVDVLGSRYVPRHDARTFLSIGVVAFGLGTATMAVLPNVALMLPARVLQGIGGGLMMGSGLQAAARLNPVQHEALITFNSSFLLGGALGAPIGGFLTGLRPGVDGYRLTLITCGVLSVLLALAFRSWLPALPPAPDSGRPTIGWPSFAPVSGMRPALVLGMIADFLRGSVVYTGLPLVGQARHLSTGTIGLAIGLLLAVEIFTIRTASVGLLRLGEMRALMTSLVLGVGLCVVLAWGHGPVPFVGAAIGFGVVVAAAAIVPPLILVAFNDADAAAGLASFRVSSGIGMLAGSAGGGAAVVLFGPTTVFAGIAMVLVGCVALARRV